ncbi:MAG: hypothetical protein WCJ28_00385 [Actinomycetota bacterium]
MDGVALIVIASAMAVFGDLSYIRDVLRKLTQPNRVSWLMWGIATLLVAFDQLHQGVGMLCLLSFAIGIGDLAVFAASFISGNGIWTLSKSDIACGIASAIGLMVWLLANNDSVALAAFLGADILATIPTLSKSWRAPESESLAPFIATAVSSILVLSTVEVWTSGAVAFALWLISINLLLILLISTKIGIKIGLRPSKQSS